MAKYLTKQRKLLLDYLSMHPDETLSVHHIAEALSGQGISISAVYRNLSAMEQDGQIRRIGIDGSREACYQYIGAGECRNCLHLSCLKCGKTFHLEGQTAEQLLRRVARNDQFCISMERTVLYGICRDCSARGDDENYGDCNAHED